MSKKTFFLGLAVTYLLSIPYNWIFVDAPMSIWIFFQLLGLLSVVAAVCFFMKGMGKQQECGLKFFLGIVRERGAEHKIKFIIVAGGFAVLIFVPVIVYPVAEFLLDLVGAVLEVILDRIPFLDAIPFHVRSWIWMQANPYVIPVYLIAYFLLYWLLCKENKSRFFHGNHTEKEVLVNEK